MASTSSSAIYTTSTRCRTPTGIPIRQIPRSVTRSGRAISCIARRPIPTIRPSEPRWGKVGKQKIIDEGPLAPGPSTGRTPYGGAGEGVGDAKYDMTTFDEALVEKSIDFMKKAKDAGKPFFLWHNTTRMHVWTFLSEKYKAMMNPETNYGMEEAGMAQMDD